MRPTTLAVPLFASIAASAALAAPPAAGPDYTSHPPEPAAVSKQLAAAKVTAAQAVESAEKAMGGSALAARTMMTGDAVTGYELVIVANGVQKRVTVDAATGKVTGAVVTLPAAIAKASEAVKGGLVREATYNITAEPPTVEVTLFKDGQRNDVVINATDGSIVSNTPVGRYPGEAFTGEIVTLPSGLQYVDIREGTGPQPADRNALVKVHYTGWLVDGKKFDSSVDRGEVASFNLSGVIPGWTEGVGSMKQGGKRKLIVPYQLAYGERGRGPIPPKATLVFDVELVDIPAAPQQ